MIQHILQRETLLPVILQEQLDEILTLLRYFLPKGDGLDFLLGQLPNVIIGKHAVSHCEEHETERPDCCGLAVIYSSAEHLRGVVKGRPFHSRVELFCIRSTPKVDQFDGLSGRIEENILSFDITVDDALTVQVLNSPCQVLDQVHFCENIELNAFNITIRSTKLPASV